jgi:hypothetical protein
LFYNIQRQHTHANNHQLHCRPRARAWRNVYRRPLSCGRFCRWVCFPKSLVALVPRVILVKFGPQTSRASRLLHPFSHDVWVSDGWLADQPTRAGFHSPAPANCGPGGGCACMYVGIHSHLLVVGAGSSISVPCLARKCDEYSNATVHYIKLYKYSLLNPIRAFPSEGRTSWVRQYCNLAREVIRIVLPLPPDTYMYAQ